MKCCGVVPLRGSAILITMGVKYGTSWFLVLVPFRGNIVLIPLARRMDGLRLMVLVPFRGYTILILSAKMYKNLTGICSRPLSGEYSSYLMDGNGCSCVAVFSSPLGVIQFLSLSLAFSLPRLSLLFSIAILSTILRTQLSMTV